MLLGHPLSQVVMSVNLAKWGQSLAVPLPKAIVERNHLQEGDRFDVRIEDDRIVLVPAGSRQRAALADLVAGITEENRHPETAWGAPVGKESW